MRRQGATRESACFGRAETGRRARTPARAWLGGGTSAAGVRNSSTTQDAGTIEQHSLKDYPDSQDIPDDELAEGLAAMLSDSTLIPPEQDISSVPTKALAGNVEWHPKLADFLHVVLDQRSPQLIFAIFGGDILALLQAPNVSFLLDRCVFCNEAVQDTEDMWPHLCNPIINSCPIKLSLYSLGIMMHQFIGHCKTFYGSYSNAYVLAALKRAFIIRVFATLCHQGARGRLGQDAGAEKHLAPCASRKRAASASNQTQRQPKPVAARNQAPQRMDSHNSASAQL